MSRSKSNRRIPSFGVLALALLSMIFAVAAEAQMVPGSGGGSSSSEVPPIACGVVRCVRVGYGSLWEDSPSGPMN